MTKLGRMGAATVAIAAFTVAGLTVKAQTQTAKTDTANKPMRLSGDEAVKSDWTNDKPGVRRLIKVSDLPKPYASKSVDNGPRLVRQPEGAWPQAPNGFTVQRMAEGFD